MRLRDRRLKFTGTLTLEREVDDALASASDAEGDPEAADAKPPRVIELAEVKGTLDDPKVSLSSKTVRSIVGSQTRKKYQRKLDEKLGEELGGEVGDLVEGLFGKKR